MALLTRAALNILGKAATERPPQAWGRTPILSGFPAAVTGTPLQHLQAYGTVGWLFATVSRIAESTARVHWRSPMFTSA